MFSLSSGGPLQHLSPFNQVINIYMPRAVARYTSDIIPTRLTREQRTFNPSYSTNISSSSHYLYPTKVVSILMATPFSFLAF
jgi:hypothetical protein